MESRTKVDESNLVIVYCSKEIGKLKEQTSQF
jgi:hypothetical protein